MYISRSVSYAFDVMLLASVDLRRFVPCLYPQDMQGFPENRKILVHHNFAVVSHRVTRLSPKYWEYNT